MGARFDDIVAPSGTDKITATQGGIRSLPARARISRSGLSLSARQVPGSQPRSRRTGAGRAVFRAFTFRAFTFVGPWRFDDPGSRRCSVVAGVRVRGITGNRCGIRNRSRRLWSGYANHDRCWAVVRHRKPDRSEQAGDLRFVVDCNFPERHLPTGTDSFWQSVGEDKFVAGSGPALATWIEYVSVAPTETGSGESDLVTARSAGSSGAGAPLDVPTSNTMNRPPPEGRRRQIAFHSVRLSSASFAHVESPFQPPVAWLPGSSGGQTFFRLLRSPDRFPPFPGAD